MANSSSFALLDERIQRYIWTEGWTELRAAQEAAIPAILAGDTDVIIAAATAAGKTEAAFLPALTRLLRDHEHATDPRLDRPRRTRSSPPGLLIYVSPLKALINDQFGRLARLCEQLDVPVWPWHGDIASSSKQRFNREPRGVLLITPESLEAMLCLRGTSAAGTLQHAHCLIVDELHAFIGSERGKQLQSLLHRIDLLLARRVPRIGLSATLGDMRLAADFLRPGANGGRDVRVIDDRAAHAELKVLIKGYEEPLIVTGSAGANAPLDAMRTDEARGEDAITPSQISRDLYRALRGSNNLVFPNSRREVERYTHLLNELCEGEAVPRAFWAHHGSLSKEIRADTEAALKRGDQPATAICTNTLELGVDIGAVKSVAQIGCPPSVASLRQRLGRSGRRKGEPAILRGYCIEHALGPKSSLETELRLRTVQSAAMVSLLLEGWFEPPAAHGLHLSTFIQQLLSIIAQNGGLHAARAYETLCATPGAPFAALSVDAFKSLLRHLGSMEILMQESGGLLLLGEKGEPLVNHYSFYAAFATEEEFRIEADGRALGSLPILQVLTVGQRILFAGRTWRVEEVNEKDKVIYVTSARGGAPPLFSGGGGRVHTRVRQRMRELLAGEGTLPYLDETAAGFLEQGRNAYRLLRLATTILLDQGHVHLLLTWLGDAGNEALAAMLNHRGFTANAADIGVEINAGSQDREAILAALTAVSRAGAIDFNQLLEGAQNLVREKWDWALPDDLLRINYGSLCLDITEARTWLLGHECNIENLEKGASSDERCGV